MASIIIRKKGDHEPCAGCARDVEIFTHEAAIARFLIVRLAERPTLGGGRCPGCEVAYCIACSTKTVYGSGMRRLHCPTCGRFLVGLRRAPDAIDKSGAFLEDPPEFSGKPAKPEEQGPNFFSMRLGEKDTPAEEQQDDS